MHERRMTRQIHVGDVPVGGGAPVSVQSMTTTKTADVDGTLSQVYALAAAGADIVRCTCNEEEAAEGLAQIVPRSPVPLVADIHFQYKLALAAMEAGVQALRLNPGNIRKPEQIKTVAREAKDRGLPIRIGVNAGSLDPDIAQQHGGATPEALVASAQRELAYFADVGFEDVKISVKSSNVPVMIDAYRLLSDTVDFPLHLGVTEAGPLPGGLVKSTVGIGTLLAEGIAAGRGKGHLFVKGKVVRVVPEAEMVDALVDEAERIMAEGIEARLAAADDGAEAEAERTREELLQIQGTDANEADEKIEKIREIAE